MDAPNGSKYTPPGFIQNMVMMRERDEHDPAQTIAGMPPNFARYVVPHVDSFQGFVSTISNIYRDYDEALKDSLDNARYMRNDCGLMECLEARQRAVALLNWHLEPEDPDSQDQKALCDELTKLLQKIARFTEYRRVLLEAIWFGKYGIQHRYGYVTVNGLRRILPKPLHENPGWLPVHGDKLVFRYAGRNLKIGQYAHQLGVRVGIGYRLGEMIRDRWQVEKIEPSDRGMAYFLSAWERKLFCVHKHMIVDGEYEDAWSAGSIHGLGVRSRIYWDWVQKQESLAFLIQYLERSAGGIEIWKYPAGNPQAKAETIEAVKNRQGIGRNSWVVPVQPGEDGGQYGMEWVEPGLGGIEVIQHLLTDYYGHRIKRYILGQTLTSEAEATGLGSGVAEAHMDTFTQINQYDATNLEETITTDLLGRLIEWNFPAAKDINVRFVIETEDPDNEKKLEAYQRAWEMGTRIKETDVLDAIGVAPPTEEDRILSNPQVAGQSPTAASALPRGRAQAAVPALDASPQKLTQQLLFHTNSELPEDEPSMYVAEGKEWIKRDVPDPAKDTGDRHKLRRPGEPDRYEYMRRDPDLRSAIDRAANETDTEPSLEQRRSGNYRKGQFAWNGLHIALENPQGSVRKGKNKLGVEWERVMPAHYGYIRRTESAADGDHVDVFMGPRPESNLVYVIDQQTDGGRFDEHKVILGCDSEKQARALYQAAYQPGWKGLKSITCLTVPQFRAWLTEGHTGKPIAAQVSRYAASRSADERSPTSLELGPGKVYIAGDGDGIGAQVEQAALADDIEGIAELSRRITAGQKVFADWVRKHHGQLVVHGGDDFSAIVDQAALDDLPALREDYRQAVGATVTIGVGSTLREGAQAMVLGKLNGKDRIETWGPDSEGELIALSRPDQNELAKLHQEGLLKYENSGPDRHHWLIDSFNRMLCAIDY